MEAMLRDVNYTEEEPKDAMRSQHIVKLSHSTKNLLVDA
jgi:hypothetical protein